MAFAEVEIIDDQTCMNLWNGMGYEFSKDEYFCAFDPGVGACEVE